MPKAALGDLLRQVELLDATKGERKNKRKIFSQGIKFFLTVAHRSLFFSFVGGKAEFAELFAECIIFAVGECAEVRSFDTKLALFV